MIYSTWRGWQVQKKDKDGRDLWLSKVYKGQAEWVTDYTHAKSFTEATAKKHDKAFTF